MEPQLVIPPNAPQQFVGPWPRLLKIISLMMLFFSVMHLVRMGINLNRLLRASSSPNGDDLTSGRTTAETINIAIIVFSGLFDVFMAVSAIRLYRRREGGLLIISLWLWLGARAVRVLQSFFQGLPLMSAISFTNPLQITVFVSFPVLVLLILREYAGDPRLPRNPWRLFVRWLID
jgi:hypothetical protein